MTSKTFNLKSYSTRRNIITGMAGILASYTAPAYITKSLIGGRESCSQYDNDPIPPVSEYIQDGLIAMWDGIENAGLGIHNPNSTVWADLVSGSYDASLSEHGRFGKNYFECLGTGTAATFTQDNSIVNNMCLEIGFASLTIPHPRYTYSICDISNGSNYKKYIWAAKDLIIFGWGRSYATSVRSSFESPFSVSANSYLYGNNQRYIDSSFLNGIAVQPELYYYGEWPYGGTMGGSLDGRYPPAKILFIRRYDRFLTQEEIEYNHSIDSARFNIL